MKYDETTNDIQDLYADITACFLAISNALEASGAVSKEQIAESFQERLLAMQPSGKPDAESPHPFLVLRELAVSLKSSPPR